MPGSALQDFILKTRSKADDPQQRCQYASRAIYRRRYRVDAIQIFLAINADACAGNLFHARQELLRIIGEARTRQIEITGHDTLKTVPRRYPRDHPRAGLLRNKGLVAWKEWPAAAWLGKAAAKTRVVDFLRAAVSRRADDADLVAGLPADPEALGAIVRGLLVRVLDPGVATAAPALLQ